MSITKVFSNFFVKLSSPICSTNQKFYCHEIRRCFFATTTIFQNKLSTKIIKKVAKKSKTVDESSIDKKILKAKQILKSPTKSDSNESKIVEVRSRLVLKSDEAKKIRKSRSKSPIMKIEPVKKEIKSREKSLSPSLPSKSYDSYLEQYQIKKLDFKFGKASFIFMFCAQKRTVFCFTFLRY
jgi:hypothetical protein